MNRAMRRFAAKNNRRKDPVSIDEMKRVIAAHKTKVAAGEVPALPVRYVSPEVSAVLASKLRIVESVLLDYSAIIRDSKTKEDFPAATFESYREDIALLENSEESAFRIYAGLLRRSIELISGDATYERTLTGLYDNLSMCRNFVQLDSLKNIKPYAGEDIEDVIEALKVRMRSEVVE